jgi:hypothetical protein
MSMRGKGDESLTQGLVAMKGMKSPGRQNKQVQLTPTPARLLAERVHSAVFELWTTPTIYQLQDQLPIRWTNAAKVAQLHLVHS